MKKIYNSILALAFTLSLANTGLAQVSTYAFTQSSGTYSAITGGSVIATATGTTAAGTLDDAVYNLPASTFPFTFTFNGIGYTGCNISTNGFITFGTTAPGGTNYSPISGAGLFAGSIAAWGRDLNSMYSAGTSSLTGEIRYEVVGSSPNREIVIQYSNWRPVYNTSGTTTNIYGMSYQIRLEETTNKISVVYGPNAFVIGSTAITGTVQVGLRGATNADYNNRLNSAATNYTSSTAGSANSSTQSFNTTVATPGMPFNGLIYSWNPPVPCSGTPNAGMAIANLTTVCTPTNVNLNLSGSTGGVTGLTYQWYSSPDGSIWNSIASATNIATTQSVTTTTYYQNVVSCGANSATSTPIQIQIATTTTNTVPYFEGFEGISAAGQLPNCSWTKTGDWTTNIGTQSNNRFPRTGTKYAHTQWTTIAGGDYIYTNGIQLTAGVNYIANAFYVVDGAAGWDEVSMLYGTSQSTTGLVNIASNYSLTNTAYQPISGTFSVASSGIYYLAFKAISPTSTPWYLSIDDISVDVAPACTTPPVAGIITGPTTVTVGTTNLYSSTGTTGNVQWYSAPALSGPWNPIAGATSVNQTITAVSAGTVYYGFIASNPGCPNDTTDVQYQVTVLFPGNDVCDAIPLSIGTSATYSIMGATTQTGEVAPPATGLNTNTGWGNSNITNTMWFTFVAPASGYVSIQSPGFDTQLALWKSTSCSGLLSSSTATLVAANDDDANYTTHGGVQYSSYLTAACLTPGATYYIQLDSYSAAVSTDATSIVITDLGTLDASFSGLASNYCLPGAADATLTPVTAGGIFTINTNTTSVTSFSPSTEGVGTYTVTYSILGCQTMSTTVVANTPTIVASTSNTIVCAGTSATLNATGATNYTWAPSGDVTATSVVSPTSNTTYSVVGETSGCLGYATVSVDVDAVVQPSVSPESPRCNNTSNFTLTANPTGGSWSGSAAVSVSGVFTPSIASVGNNTVIYTYVNGNCTSTTSVIVPIEQFVTAALTSSIANQCESNSAFDLNTTASPSFTTGTWSGTGVTGSMFNPATSGTGTITLTYLTTSAPTASLCPDTRTINVVVNAIPSVSAFATQTVLCDDGSTGASILTVSTSATSYTWSEGSTTMSISVTPTVTTDYTVTVTEGACSTEATVLITISNCTGVKEQSTNGISVYPNPNNGLITITIHTNFTSNTLLEVYDALGKLVIKESLTNEETTINTSKLEDGIYIYKIINNNKEVKIGRMIKQ